MDWITGNVYGGGSGGILFVCKPVTGGQMKCETLLTGQGQINGIALDPNSGYDSVDKQQISTMIFSWFDFHYGQNNVLDQETQ